MRWDQPRIAAGRRGKDEWWRGKLGGALFPPNFLPNHNVHKRKELNRIGRQGGNISQSSYSPQNTTDCGRAHNGDFPALPPKTTS